MLKTGQPYDIMARLAFMIGAAAHVAGEPRTVPEKYAAHADEWLAGYDNSGLKSATTTTNIDLGGPHA